MTESDTTAARAPVRELHRSRDDRVVAGVAGGLGRYFDLPPIFFRVAFLVLAFVGGAGILLYAAAALVIPDEGKRDSIAVEALREHRDRPWLLVGAALVGLATLSLISQARFWPNGGLAWTLLVLGAIAIAWSQRRDEDSAAVAEGAPPPASRPSLALPTLGLLLAAGGLLALLGVLGVAVPWDIALAVAAIAVGLVVALGAIFHRRTGVLFLVGLVLAATAIVVSTVDIQLSGSIGERTVHAGTVSDLQRNYDVAVGELVLDLSDVALPAGETRIDADVGIGQLTVTVPDGVNVDVDATTGAGRIEVLGHVRDGWDENVHVDEQSFGSTSTLILDANVGVGEIDVHRTSR
jgi:phage shock protein PspC (stress-responsive transcriptional regulator)/predicted membrane protein